MATVLDKKYTNKDSLVDILKAIKTLASDENRRILLTEDVEWKETKLNEIARLSEIALGKI